MSDDDPTLETTIDADEVAAADPGTEMVDADATPVATEIDDLDAFDDLDSDVDSDDASDLDGDDESDDTPINDIDGDGKVSILEAERARLGLVDARLEEIAHHGGVTGHIADAAHKLLDKFDND